jgi:hypothetical protein
MVESLQETSSLSTYSREVFVLGAGFTKAFLPNAPLMVDDYGGAVLAKKFENFDYASRVLEWERTHNQGEKINIERLLTRLAGHMPYDYDQKADEELGMLLVEVKKSYINRIEAVRENVDYMKYLNDFAEYCVSNNIICITFNYDDVFDEAIWKVAGSMERRNKPYWNPDGGYGFFCRPSRCAVEDMIVQKDIKTDMLLLKLHGSINWYPRRGYTEPYSVDAIMHHERWYEPTKYAEINEDVKFHIEPEPFLVPPILVKSAIVEQPILRLLWYLAYEALFRARKVTFVGYSCPLTDIAVRILFEESLELLETKNIYVVNLAKGDSEAEKIIDAYREVFTKIPTKQFDFKGAFEWAKELGSK